MELLDFSEYLFDDIPIQDNPAYDSKGEEVVMVVKNENKDTAFDIVIVHLAIFSKLTWQREVTKLCECYNLEHALRIGEFLSTVK